MKIAASLALICLVTAGFFLTSRPAGERRPASRHLPPFSRWQLIGVYPLAGQTGHPQGLNVTREGLSLSYQGATVAGINDYRLTRTGDRISSVTLDHAYGFPQYPGLTHAGGLGRSRDRSIVYIPIAAKPFGDTVIVEFKQGHVREVARFPFHIGTVFTDPATDVLHAIGFDEGARFEIFGNSVYTVDLKSGARVASFKPASGESFQDCKPLTLQGNVLCSNKSGSNAMTLRGSVDLVHFDRDGSYQVIERLPVPHVNLDGSFGAEWGPYVPGYFGTPPLTYNAFDFEWSTDQAALYFYFVPNDFPNTRLYAYKLVLE